MIKNNNTHNDRKNFPFEISIIASLSYILFPYVLTIFIMTFTNSANSILTIVSSFFSLLIGIITLSGAVICLKFRKQTKKQLITKIISIVNIVLTSIMCLASLFEVIYCFGLPFPYLIVLVDILFVAYVPIAIIVLGGFITILLIEQLVKTPNHERSV